MAKVIAGLNSPLGYVISKGGTTSFTMLKYSLGCDQLRLLGQMRLGVSMLIPGRPHQRFNLLPVLTIPGNLGDTNLIKNCWHDMESIRVNRF